MGAWTSGPFLISAAPGAGKTRPALELARTLLRERIVQRVAVVCPTTPLTRQWAAAAARLGPGVGVLLPAPPADAPGARGRRAPGRAPRARRRRAAPAAGLPGR